MRSAAALAIVLALLAAPAWAQHGASHGGFSGGHSGSFGRSAPARPSSPLGHASPIGRSGPVNHPAPMGHGTPMSPGRFSRSAPMRFGTQGRIPVARQPYNGDAHIDPREHGWNQGGRDGDHDHDRDGDRDHPRRPYWRGYELGLQYGYLGWPGYPFLWNGPGFNDPGFYDYTGYDSEQTPYADSNGPAANSANQDSMQPYPDYAGAPAAATRGGDGSPAVSELRGPRASYSGPADVAIPPPPQQTVTVVFNDGRPSEQIRNYLITPTTLTVLDHKYREIPLEQINLAATQETNRADGIDFRVPQASR